MDAVAFAPEYDSIRKLGSGDIEQIKALVVESAVFNDYAVHEILDSIEYYLGYPDGEELLTYIYAVDGRVAGFISFGIGLGQKTYEIYWLCVSPQYQGRGVGSRLLGFVESYIKNAGGRMVFIETYSKKEYERARMFYDRMGYRISAVVEDYFDDGDDKVIYSKRLF